MDTYKYEDQNVNTINIPKQTKAKSGEICPKLNTDEIEMNNKNALMYKLSIRKVDESAKLLSREFDELVREIVSTNNASFLQGNLNLIEFLISKHSLSDSDDLGSQKTISLKVRENFGMLNEFGHFLANLVELNLSGSVIKSVQEIGTSFNSLVTLNISNCNVVDLSGIFCFRNLRSLDCSFNLITDLLELEMCHTIEKINLRNNEIEEEDNLIFVANLSNLKYINLNNNPIQLKAAYLRLVQQYLSHVEVIDKDLAEEEI